MRADAPQAVSRSRYAGSGESLCACAAKQCGGDDELFHSEVLDNRASAVLLFSANRLLVRANDGHAVLSFCEAPRHRRDNPSRLCHASLLASRQAASSGVRRRVAPLWSSAAATQLRVAAA
jgi:hypothetical protein